MSSPEYGKRLRAETSNLDGITNFSNLYGKKHKPDFNKNPLSVSDEPRVELEEPIIEIQDTQDAIDSSTVTPAKPFLLGLRHSYREGRLKKTESRLESTQKHASIMRYVGEAILNGESYYNLPKDKSPVTERKTRKLAIKLGRANRKRLYYDGHRHNIYATREDDVRHYVGESKDSHSRTTKETVFPDTPGTARDLYGRFNAGVNARTHERLAHKAHHAEEKMHKIIKSPEKTARKLQQQRENHTRRLASIKLAQAGRNKK